MNYEELNGKTIREGFIEFNEANPHVFKAFEAQALNAIHRGRTKLSAKMIVNWIRWNEYLRSTDQNFKINDAYQAYYARYFMGKHPEHQGIFELRKLRNEEEAPFMQEDENGQLTFM